MEPAATTPAEPALNVALLILLRKNAGMTRPQLAKAAHLDPSQLWRIETGRAVPYDSTIGRLARALGVPVAVLIAA